MSDIVKAALIIGVAIILSQGFFIQTSTDKITFVTNKFTGDTIHCYGKICDFSEPSKDK